MDIKFLHMKDSPVNLYDSCRSRQLQAGITSEYSPGWSSLLRLPTDHYYSRKLSKALGLAFMAVGSQKSDWSVCPAQILSLWQLHMDWLEDADLWARTLIPSFSSFALKREPSRTQGGWHLHDLSCPQLMPNCSGMLNNQQVTWWIWNENKGNLFPYM